MLRYMTYGILLLIVVAAVAGFANAVDERACSSYATYSHSAGDCVYRSSYYNNLAIQWRNDNPYASQYSNPYSKYTNWYDSSTGYYHAYDTAPRYTGYTFDGDYYPNRYAAYESVYRTSSGDGATQYGRGYDTASIVRGSSTASYYASDSNYGTGNTYVRDSFNTYYNGDVYSNSFNNYGSSGGYNYGSYGCTYSYYGCGASYYPYSYSAWGYAHGGSPGVYVAYWSSH